MERRILCPICGQQVTSNHLFFKCLNSQKIISYLCYYIIELKITLKQCFELDFEYSWHPIWICLTWSYWKWINNIIHPDNTNKTLKGILLAQLNKLKNYYTPLKNTFLLMMVSKTISIIKFLSFEKLIINVYS